jgi:hypothetical protein
MSTKKRIIERANKRLLNEDVPPPVNFNQYEVLDLLCELIDYDLGGKQEMPTKLVKVFQEALKKKGRNLTPPNTPLGAMM